MDVIAFVLYVAAFVVALLGTFNTPARWNLVAGALACFFAGWVLTHLP